MNRYILSILSVLAFTFGMDAQIAYQVSLMDQSTGAPRANETVSVTVTISDNTGKSLCTSSESVTTNDFGMLSMQVGDSSTFQNLSEGVLPLWVEAKVGGVTIGKSQILNVPVAEYARNYGQLTIEKLCSRTWYSCGYKYDFRSNGNATKYGAEGSSKFSYSISGDFVILKNSDSDWDNELLVYIHSRNELWAAIVHGINY